MRAQKLVLWGVFLTLAGLLPVAQLVGQGTPGAAGSTGQTTEEQQRTHKQCMKAAERVQRDARNMSPGRSWTWELQAKDSLRDLGGLRRDLNALWDSQAAFEASLTQDQASKFDSQLQAIHQLHQHLDEDLKSLELELQKGYPTRWHVAADLADVEKEVHRFEEKHEEIAAAIGLAD